MHRRLSAVLHGVLALGLVASIGCGSSKGLVSASGRVELDGQPLANGYVTMEPAGGKGPRAIATVKNGSYSLMTGDETGAMPGDYNVKVIAYGDAPPPKPKESASPPPVITPAKYADPATSGLKVKIGAGGGVDPPTLSLSSK